VNENVETGASTAYTEALERYERALADSTRWSEIAATAPSEENNRAAQDAYAAAQQCYADLAAIHESLGAPAESSAGTAEAEPLTHPVTPALAGNGADGVVILRRGTPVRLVPSPGPEDEAFVVKRNLLGDPAAPRRHELTRNRKIAGNLPEWSPMPPGEIVAPVKRRKS
jgi:hypothetical protein